MKKILVITDMDFRSSGYHNIAIGVLSGMGDEYETKVIGLNYMGEENTYPFSVIPTRTIYDAIHMASNLEIMWQPDILLVMMDIPLQIFFFNNLPNYKSKYIALTPMENGPLTLSWATVLMQMKSILFISELGRDEARKVGVQQADYIQIGIDIEKWRVASSEEKSQFRKGLGFDEDTFIVLQVADNQERKNLWAGMSAIEHLKRKVPLEKKIRYILVTREDNEVGWRLRDLALSMGMSQEFVIYQRGMPQKDLWVLYSVADAFILTSKAEGLGMPILEAMASGVPVVGTDTGAIHELLSDGRGHLISPEYTFVDVWGNSKRDMIDIEKAALALRSIMDGEDPEVKQVARSYVESRTWDIATEKLKSIVERTANEQKPQTPK